MLWSYKKIPDDVLHALTDPLPRRSRRKDLPRIDHTNHALLCAPAQTQKSIALFLEAIMPCMRSISLYVFNWRAACGKDELGIHRKTTG